MQQPKKKPRREAKLAGDYSTQLFAKYSKRQRRHMDRIIEVIYRGNLDDLDHQDISTTLKELLEDNRMVEQLTLGDYHEANRLLDELATKLLNP